MIWKGPRNENEERAELATEVALLDLHTAERELLRMHLRGFGKGSLGRGVINEQRATVIARRRKVRASYKAVLKARRQTEAGEQP